MKQYTRQHNTGARHGGFTLISLMIVVAIIGILAAIAYPSYMNQVRQSRRTGAISLLMRAANEQAQFYTINHEYADSMDALGLPDETKAGWYAESRFKADQNSFLIKLKAQEDQLNDTCATYVIDETGKKLAFDARNNKVSSECW